MKSNFYVDNLICSITTKVDPKEFYVEAKSVFREAGMNLREWVTNDDELLKIIPADNIVQSKDHKVLGLQWNILDDTMSIRCSDAQPSLRQKSSTTKRHVLQVISTVCDPLEWVDPVVVPAKVFMQDVWPAKTRWDSPLPKVCAGSGLF